MFREEIEKHSERASTMLDAYPDIAHSEALAQTSLIQPFYAALGYDPGHPEQVTPEVKTEQDGRIDYVLTGENGSTIAVETKKPAVKLTDKEIKQLRSYFTFSEAVAGILTNGVHYWLFTDLDKRNIMDFDPYRKIDIRDISSNDLRHLETLARGEVSQDRVHKQARQERYQAQINSIVAEELRSPSLEFLKLVGKKAGIKPLNQKNLAFLNPLVEEAISQNVREGTQPASPADSPPASSEAISTREIPAPGLTPGKLAADTKRRFKGATLFGEDLDVKNYREMLLGVVAEIQTRHEGDFAQRVREEPFFKTTRKWQYISTDEGHFHPQHAKTQVGVYWVSTQMDAKTKIRRAHLFLKAFGYNPKELEIHISDD